MNTIIPTQHLLGASTPQANAAYLQSCNSVPSVATQSIYTGTYNYTGQHQSWRPQTIAVV